MGNYQYETHDLMIQDLEVADSRLSDLIGQITDLYLRDDKPWIVGFSGGKDSTVVLSLVFQALMRRCRMPMRQQTTNVAAPPRRGRSSCGSAKWPTAAPAGLNKVGRRRGWKVPSRRFSERRPRCPQLCQRCSANGRGPVVVGAQLAVLPCLLLLLL